jgi:predicted glycosyltransferase
MRIWVDLVNSPQVLFFRPILPVLARQGHDLIITTRDYGQTLALADQHHLAHTPIGRHGGKSVRGLVEQNLLRVRALVEFIGDQRIDLAVGHNVYSQALAARWRRIPLVTLMDYEHQPANHLNFRLAQRVIVPQPFPAAALRKYGARPSRVARYSGLKEELYLADFVPAANPRAQLGIPADAILVVMRPPATWAPYHRSKQGMFDDALRYVAAQPGVAVVFLPRIEEQAAWARSLGLANLHIPPAAVDGPNLLYHADLVISGGGTMNREAAVLGTPACTVFAGERSAVDAYLVDAGRLIIVTDPAELSRIKVAPKTRQLARELRPQLVDQVVRLILETPGARGVARDPSTIQAG